MMATKYMMKFVGRIVTDFKQKQLLPLKLLFFVHASTLYVLYPYLTIHMRELGINVEETAIMSAVTPVVAIVMPPLAGMIADKIGNFKLLLSLFSTLGGMASLLLLLVPVGRITVTYPERVILDFGCSGVPSLNTDFKYGYLELGLAEDIPCNQTAAMRESQEGQVKLNTTLEACGFICQSTDLLQDIPEYFKPSPQVENEPELSVDSVLKGRSYAILVTNAETGEVKTYSYDLTRDEVPRQHTKTEALDHRFMKMNDQFRRSIQRLSKNDYFFPTTGLYNLTCRRVSGEDDKDEVESSDFLLSASRFSGRARRDANETEEAVAVTDHYVCYMGTTGGGKDTGGRELVALMRRPYQTRLLKMSGQEDEFSMGSRFRVMSVRWPQGNSSKPTGPFVNASCLDSILMNKENVSAAVYLHNPENNLEILHTIQLPSCEPRCLVTAARKDICTNLAKEVTYDPHLTFWVYMAIRVFIGMIGGTAFAMFEGAVIAILREQKADYGLQRIYASIGGMISSPLSGLLIDYASSGKGYTDFRPAFYLYAGLKILSGGLMLLINLEFKSGANNVVTDVLNVLKNIEIIALLVACFVLGTAWGYIESFLFWLLQDLGGSRSLMGITITVGGIAGIPLLVLSGPIIDKIGHANVIFIGFVFYAIRLLGYSLIYNPWHCLIFEAMESITSSLSFTAAVTYAAKLSTTTTDSSIQGLLGGLYFGVGKGAGSLVGGYLMKGFGTRPTYQIFAVFTAFTGCIYFLFNHFYLRKRPQTIGNDICKKVEPIDLKIVKEKESQISGSFATNNNKDGDIKPADLQSQDNFAYIDDPVEAVKEKKP